ncbi:MAG: copper chaperone PCu(A)C, partial [Paracoccaceae bacterium]|nr:copper chaperone PCu(A)C [Paracoccaceae bacterium]
LEIIHAHIPAPMASAKSAAGYMAISNEATTPDRLIGVEAGFAAKATLHTSDVTTDGIARMVPLDGIDIPADDTVVLEPGELHIMFMGLNRSLAVGDMLPVTLIFQNGGRLDMEFMVDPADGTGGGMMDHSQMGH